jgi:glycosyltransferase involved in cell wall biosynthesis
MTGVSIIYVTHRPEPRFDWFADSLAAQLGADDPEVIFVDGLHSTERAAQLEQVVAGRFAHRHVTAKPSPWNGPHRLTGKDYFASASARNTGIVCATRPYVVFVDDCSVLMPGWWSEARTAARHEYVVAGAYQYHREMAVENGVLVRSRHVPDEPDATDCRWDQGHDEALVKVGGGHLFGCSFGAPRALLVELGGQDELVDAAEGADCQLGLRLEWAGVPILYSRRMLTIESTELHEQRSKQVIGLARDLEPPAYMARLREFGVDRRTTDGAWDNANMILDIAYGTRSTRSLGNYYDLAALQEADFDATIAAFPRTYWFDRTPLGEL